MSFITFSQLRKKAVINVCDGSIIGYIVEIEFDAKTGKITSFALSQGHGILSIFRDSLLTIPWRDVECIGSDSVLVRASSPQTSTSRK